MSKPIPATCDTTYKASRSSGTRDVKVIKWIVLHDTEGSTAKGAAAWFADTRTPEQGGPSGSAHLCVDNDECYRTLQNEQVPWAAPGANVNGFHIEQAGFASWTRTDWLTHDKELRRSAYKAAYHAKLFNVPLRWVGKWGLKLGRAGFTTHADITAAFGGTHTDPGPNFPKDKYMEYVKSYFAALA